MHALGAAAFSLAQSLIPRLFPDPEKRAEATLRLAELEQKGELVELEQRMKAIVAEAQSESWLARNWRPITMLTFVAIVANNYILYPYLTLFGVPSTMLETPEQLWNLINIGLGGYVIGRSAEKVAKVWKENHPK